MRAGGSSDKGAAFERKICRDLSKWLSKDIRDDLFWRSAMSGGRATLGLNQDILRKAQSGDVTAIDEMGLKFASKFVVECKNYKDLELHKLIYGGNTGLIKFWNETVQQADEFDKHPFLIAKQNFKPELLCLNGEGLELFDEFGDFQISYFPLLDLHMFFWADFLDETNSESLKWVS